MATLFLFLRKDTMKHNIAYPQLCCLETMPMVYSRSKHGKRLKPYNKRYASRLVRQGVRCFYDNAINKNN